MIQYFDIEIIPGIFDLSREIQILGRGSQASGRMIMSEDDMTGIPFEGGLKYHFGIHYRTGHTSAAHPFLSQHIVASIKK